MTSLETRLQATEAALYATLLALHDQGGMTSVPVHIQTGESSNAKPLRSKAEKQHEWKQLPLRTSEDLAAWFQEQQCHAIRHDTQRDSAPAGNTSLEEHPVLETPTTHSASNLCRNQLSALDRPVSKPSDDVMERLKSCRPPKAPNAWFSVVESTAWMNNYF
jgi:hypothetical protein